MKRLWGLDLRAFGELGNLRYRSVEGGSSHKGKHLNIGVAS